MKEVISLSAAAGCENVNIPLDQSQQAIDPGANQKRFFENRFKKWYKCGMDTKVNTLYILVAYSWLEFSAYFQHKFLPLAQGSIPSFR